MLGMPPILGAGVGLPGTPQEDAIRQEAQAARERVLLQDFRGERPDQDFDHPIHRGRRDLQDTDWARFQYQRKQKEAQERLQEMLPVPGPGEKSTPPLLPHPRGKLNDNPFAPLPREIPPPLPGFKR